MKRKSSGLTSHRLGLESLESRSMLAGNVTASVVNGVLNVQGDALDNLITIQQVAKPASSGAWTGVKFEIKGDSTTINGKASILVDGVKQGVNVHLAKGNDVLRIEKQLPLGSKADPRANLPGKVDIRLGDGTDKAYLFVTNQNKFSVDLGKGEYVLRMDGSALNQLNVRTGVLADGTSAKPDGGTVHRMELQRVTTNKFRITTGVEQDQINLAAFHTNDAYFQMERGARIQMSSLGDNFSKISGNVTIKTGASSRLDFSMYFYEIGGRLSIQSGGGFDRVSLLLVRAKQGLDIDTKGGDDFVILDYVQSPTTALHGGAGTDDALVLQGVNEFGVNVTDGFERTSPP